MSRGGRGGGPLNLVCIAMLLVGLISTALGSWQIGLPMLVTCVVVAIGNAIRVYRRGPE